MKYLMLTAAAAALAGCSAAATVAPAAHAHSPAPSAPAAAPATTAPPAPGPVPAAATLSGSCATGYEMVDGDRASGVFLTGQLPPVDPSGANPALAYQLTLSNTSQATADVAGFAVAFSDASGSETGSDRQDSLSGYILPGQSLTWTVLADQTVNGYGTGGNPGGPQTSSIPAGAASCQLVEWYHP